MTRVTRNRRSPGDPESEKPGDPESEKPDGQLPNTGMGTGPIGLAAPAILAAAGLSLLLVGRRLTRAGRP